MTPLLSDIEQRLRWTGFRSLTQAEVASGPFSRVDREQGFVRLDPAIYNIAFVSQLESGAEVECFLDRLGPTSWGYDLNLERHADQTATVNELWFAVLRGCSLPAEEFRWLGYEQRDQSWMRSDPACPVPALGPNYAGEVYPCLGWVLLPGSTSEFGPAEQRAGFCSKAVPAGARANRAVRGYQFVYEGYPERMVLRRRIVTFIDIATDADVAQLINGALALTYGEA